MRLRTLIPVCLMMLLAACTRSFLEEEKAAEEKGVISIEMSPEVLVKSSTIADSDLPDPSEFTIEIYKYKESGPLRLYRDSYENTTGRKITLNAADYLVHARCGDSLGVGFNSIYFSAESDVTVRHKSEETVSLVAKMASVKVAVQYGQNLIYDWTEYYAKVKTVTKGGRKRSLQFSQTETRAGYIPAGKMTVELYIKVGEEWRYYHSPEMEAHPNDFITFNLDTERADGSLSMTARVERGTQTIEKDYVISSEWLPKDAPSIVMNDLTGNSFGGKSFTVVEANNQARGDLKADLKVPGRMDHCYLEVTSEYLRKMGVPERIDLAEEMDPAVEQALKSVGLKWMNGMKGQRLGYIDFSGVTKWLDKITYDASNPFSATFSINVTDQRQAMGECVSQAVTIAQGRPSFEIYNIPAYCCWAWKIDNLTANISVGNPEKLTMEYKKSTDPEAAWTAISPSETSGSRIKTYNLSGLSPATTYNFRLRYNGNASTQVVRSAVTESPNQLGNAGFETWTQQGWSFQQDGIFGITSMNQSSPMPWYQPWSGSDQWWDTNAKASLKTGLTSGYTYFKSFPLVHYSTNAHSGSRSAQITVVNVGNANSTWGTTGTWYEGELFIGRGNDSNSSWAYTTKGHSFSTRPYGISFWYQYVPQGSDAGTLVLELKSGGSNIATASYSIQAASQWTKITVPLTYSMTTSTASNIFVSFKASSVSSHSPIDGEGGSYLEIAGANNTGDKYRIKLASLLRVDDVELIYEPF